VSDRLITRCELATKLGVTVEWTYRHLPQQHDFPRAALPNRWSESAIDTWITRRSGVTLTHRSNGDSMNAASVDWDNELDRRAMAIAGS